MFTRLVAGCLLMLFIVSINAQTPPSNTGKTPPAKKIQSTKTTPPAPSSGMYVKRAAIALDVENREPRDTATVFPPAVKRLYCFTEIMDGEGEEIQHRWYWNDDLLSAVPLKINSKRYRTYSAKTIVPGMTGEWHVAIVNSKNEEVLQMLKFEIK